MKIYRPNNYSYITVVEIAKSEIQKMDFALCKQPRETLKSFYDSCSVKPDFIINGGFFSMSDGSTCFNYINDGKIISSVNNYLEGFGLITGNLSLCHLNDENFTDFISGYPVLIKNGVALPITYAHEINYNARRSVIGYDSTNIYLIAVELPGITFQNLQKVLLNLGITNAINLDGGGSTKILHKGISITSSSYNRPVDNVFCVYLKEEQVTPPKTIFRVQTGTFSVKSNAELLQNRIRALSDTIGAGYARAYVRQINGLYKVQVGAFSVRENAVKVVNDLGSKGFSSFITTI